VELKLGSAEAELAARIITSPGSEGLVVGGEGQVMPVVGDPHHPRKGIPYEQIVQMGNVGMSPPDSNTSMLQLKMHEMIRNAN
jgi:hypothetical protein